ncbi:MAG: cob(I)yrinic acid a,c-diamide adenosyltransferase [Verrucomicrobia bacterium]|nr:cob(I)yrinic acid a,c-diamide adenosyltransferase [Verrucomicrobiota bacterium]
MSIATRTGDMGTTGLMYGRRVRKDSPRVEAYGEVDEFNACLGLARAQASGEVRKVLETIQKALVGLMGELAVSPEDLARYEGDGYARLKEEDLSFLDEQIELLEGRAPKAQGWSMPGGSVVGAALDLARTVCRRSERAVWRLGEKEEKVRILIPKYLNRLSDLLWLLEQSVETDLSAQEKTKKS